MSNIPPEVSESEYPTNESLEVTMTMGNLTLESVCSSCPLGQCKCIKRSLPPRHLDKQSNVYPDFWRKTLANRILDHKSKCNKKKIPYEILKPSKLQYVNLNLNMSQSQFRSPLSNKLSRSAGFLSPDDCLPSFSATPHQKSMELTKSSSEGSLAISDADLEAGGRMDLNKLRIRSQTQISVVGAMAAMRLNDTFDIAAQLSGLQWVKKTPRWKTRGTLGSRKSLYTTALPTIPEDSSEAQVGGSFKSLSLNISPAPNTNNATQSVQSCSQQALTESNTNGNGNSGSDDITIDELASYFDLHVNIPKKMSPMAEMMYT